jgi:hypothetical protein
MNWFWLNVPAGILFVAAWSGIPFWLVLKHPDWAGRPEPATRKSKHQTLNSPALHALRRARPLERI